MTERKVIQIAIAATHQPYALEPLQMLYALCDDGTMWGYDGGFREWKPVKPIPQPSDSPAEERQHG